MAPDRRIRVHPAQRPCAWIPALAGLTLLALGARAGFLALILAAIPGSLLLTGGVRSLLAPDLLSPQQAAIGASLGMLLALPLGLAGSAALGLVAFAVSGASFVAAGWLEIQLQPHLEGVPAPDPAPGYAARVALDDAILNAMSLAAPVSSAGELREAARETEAAHALFVERGWIEDPRRFHATPPAADAVASSPTRIRGLDCEHLRFESGFEPDPALPQREAWLAHRENRTSHAWVVRRDESAPWLVCVHGFGMGDPNQDFRAFRVKELHERTGLNLATVALPVHGPRSPGRFSGMEFMGISPMTFVHAEAQAVWDLRRLIGWIRSQGASEVGVHGISLGGYTSAVLAGLEEGLACVIAGVPPADLIATGERLASSLERRTARAAGIDVERERALHRVVSPLALSPLAERDRRFLYAATGDQFVPIEQVRALWLHWEQPHIRWCVGGHISALMQRESRTLVGEAIAASFTPTSNA